ncbi:uncharacterized protein LOC143426758 isoform X1 [Xylocopa sonorina]|uniref:uncharacterized protein LOC143426758 isoform X1 n=1 Tax=Xylocopa sonorina TaxID=1818115 RepID=UPI00403AD830
MHVRVLHRVHKYRGNRLYVFHITVNETNRRWTRSNACVKSVDFTKVRKAPTVLDGFQRCTYLIELSRCNGKEVEGLKKEKVVLEKDWKRSRYASVRREITINPT